MHSESSQIEYKRELPKSPDKLEKEVVSFLNADGGTIYFGIDNEGTVVGVENPDELQLQLKDRIKNNLSIHALDYCKISLEMENDKNVVVLKIDSGWEKTFLCQQIRNDTERLFQTYRQCHGTNDCCADWYALHQEGSQQS